MKKIKNNTLSKSISITKNEALIALASLHVLFFYVMNIYCMKPLSFGMPFIVMEAGYFLSWTIPIIISIITEIYGAKLAKYVTIISIIISIFLSFLTTIIIFIPTTSNYYLQGEHFRYVFGSNIRVIIASLLALFFSNFTNIYIISKLKRNKSDNSVRAIFIRGLLSSTISQFIDNAVFEFLAFAPLRINRFEMKILDIISIILVCTLIEVILESIFFYPITVFITKKIEKLKD